MLDFSVVTHCEREGVELGEVSAADVQTLLRVMEGVLGLVFREQGYLLVQTQRTVVVAFAAEEGGEVAQRIQDDWTVAGQCA